MGLPSYKSVWNPLFHIILTIVLGCSKYHKSQSLDVFGISLPNLAIVFFWGEGAPLYSFVLGPHPSAKREAWVHERERGNSSSGWWFGCHQFYFPRNIGNVIIPIDELVFFIGVETNHQPVMFFLGENNFDEIKREQTAEIRERFWVKGW